MSGFAAFGIAFVAGTLSFLSPCVLPLIPGYLSFMTGLSATELSDERSRARIIVPALLFVLGFTLVFTAFGATASVLGQLLDNSRVIVERVAGVLIVAFGVLMLGIIKVPWLYGEARVDMEKSRAFGRGASVVMGAAFAAGWTPCVGPILGTILTLAGSTGSVGRGALLLVTYSLGLGVPFVAVAVLFGRMAPLMRWVTRHSLILNRVAGILLIIIGVLIASGRFGPIAAMLTRSVPGVEISLPQIQ